VIKIAFCNPKKLANSDVWDPKVLSTSFFDIEKSMFKLTMKSNACVVMVKPIDVNLMMCLWYTLSASKLLIYLFLEYFKLAKITMVRWKLSNVLIPWHSASPSSVID
jgi:hypothetical protein